MNRPISLAPLTALEVAPPEFVSTAAAAGYSHVGLRLVAATTTEPQYPMVGDTPMVRETRARLDATGIRLLDVEILRLRPDTRVADFLPAIETGARLGASYVRVAGDDPDVMAMLRGLADRYAELCDLAAPCGVSPQLEFMSWSHAKDLAQAARIVARAGRGQGGIVVDAFHFHRSGSRLEDIARVPPSRFRYAQLCDAPLAIPPPARAERRFPGEGELDLVPLVRALPADLPLSLEVPTLELAKSVGALDRARRALCGARAVLARAAERDAAASTGEASGNEREAATRGP